MDPHTSWYIARASGIVAFALLSSSVIWGLLLSTRLFGRGLSPSWTLDVHRFLGGLSVAFTGLHIAGLVADTTVSFGTREIFVPLASAWRPGAIAWGVFAMYALVAVELTSLLQRKLPRRLWRAVHLVSFVAFLSAAAHGAFAGSDASSPYYVWFAAGTLWAVMFLVLVRLLTSRRGSPRPVAG